MKTLKARVLGVLELQPYRMKDKSGDQSKNTKKHGLKLSKDRSAAYGP
jgi:hypothetical protein